MKSEKEEEWNGIEKAETIMDEGIKQKLGWT